MNFATARNSNDVLRAHIIIQYSLYILDA